MRGLSRFEPDCVWQCPGGSLIMASKEQAMTRSTTRLLLAGLPAACCAEIAQAQTATATLVGRSVIVHKDADDCRTQPTGNSRARVACGIIKKS